MGLLTQRNEEEGHCKDKERQATTHCGQPHVHRLEYNDAHELAEDDRRRACLKEARKHFRFCVKVYKYQMNQHRYYVHEHQ